MLYENERERERDMPEEQKREIVCVCVSVCARESEGERERECVCSCVYFVKESCHISSQTTSIRQRKTQKSTKVRNGMLLCILTASVS